jgi:hypothetical protein
MESVTTTWVVGTNGKFTVDVTTISVNLGKDVSVSVVDFGGQFAASVIYNVVHHELGIHYFFQIFEKIENGAKIIIKAKEKIMHEI